MNRSARVSENYSVIYTNPIKVKAGERVTIEKWETNPEWLGWAFCVDPRGVKGWVSEKYLAVSGTSASVLRDYDATELGVAAGEEIKIHREEFGWAWVENANGEQGWIPLKILSLPAYSFRPMTEEDLPLLFRWASEPHVKQWWDTEKEWADFRLRYLENINSKDSFPHIVSFNQRPLGYINYWTVESDPNFRSLFPAGSVGTDQFIGEPDLIGQGHGHKFVRAFSDQLLENPKIPVVMTDPNSENMAAIRCYEKAGFTKLKLVKTSEGQSLVMERRK